MNFTYKLSICLTILFFSLSAPQVSAQDPGLPGAFGFEKLSYDLGDIFQPSEFQTSMVEVSAVVHRPTMEGVYPLVVILHGRHGVCFSPGSTSANISYPCGSGEEMIPNHEGYNYLGELLASRGFITVSIRSNGIVGVSNGGDDNQPDFNMLARAELIQHHLDLWNDWNQDGSDPFGGIFQGKVNMDKIITAGHSRGGEGVVRHYIYNKTQAEPYNIAGVFAIAPTMFNFLSDPTMNLAVVMGDCDGDLTSLPGLYYYDRQRYESVGTGLAGTYHNIIMKGANHNFFNTIWTPEFFTADASDEWQNFVDGDSNDSYCGTNSATNQRMTSAMQRNSLAAYLSAFVETYASGSLFYTDILNGIRSPPPTTTVTEEQINISFHIPIENRIDISRQLLAAELSTNDLGGTVTSAGLSLAEHCALDDDEFCGEESRLDDHYINNDNGSYSLSRLQIDWTTSGGWIQQDIPAAQSDLSSFNSLAIRVAVNVNTDNSLNTGEQNFKLELTDGNGDSQVLLASNYSEALALPFGTESNILPRSLSNTIAFPLIDFDQLDLTNIVSFRFVFDQNDSGSLFFSDIAAVRFICVPGLACNDGDPCTTGEIFDENCNCLGGVTSPNDADNDGVCDEFDICEGGDDSIDTDLDDIPDFCDPCPLFPDTDGDGFCDDIDACEGFDDNLDMDADGIPDNCDICANDAENLCIPENYCVPGIITGDNFFISQVTLGNNLINSSSNWSTDGYFYYDDPVSQIELGTTYNLDVTVTDDNLFAKLSAWIDFDRNGIFDDDEMIIDEPDIDENISVNFTVPIDAVKGGSRLRIVYARGVLLDAISCPEAANISVIGGETEDYALFIDQLTSTASQVLENECSLQNRQTRVFPNPATSNQNITIATSNILNIEKIELVNALGRIVNSWQKITSNNGSSIDLGAIQNPGLYFLKIYRNDNCLLVKKIISN